MNLIVICIDSLRRDHLGCYGNSWIRTQNFDRFAKESVVFDGFNLNAIPTVPFRRALMLGRRIWPFKDAVKPAKDAISILGWQPLEMSEMTLQDALQRAGYVTGMISDVENNFRPGCNFHKGFHSWQFLRGQEGDHAGTGTSTMNVDRFMHPALENTRAQEFLEQYLRNIDNRRTEEDYFAPRVFRKAQEWLERNARQYEKFYLYIDSFDPHEPWDPPQEYVDFYDPGYKGKEIIFPQAGPIEDITPEELKHIRALYAGEVSMVDRWFGHFMEKFYNMGLDKNTIVLLVSDHGHPLGEHGIIRKLEHVLYPELLDAMLMMKIPDASYYGKRVKEIVQEYDIAPTLLSLLNVEIPDAMDGVDFWPVVTGDREKIHEYAAGGYNAYAYVRDHRYHYFRSLKDATQRFLFNLKKDPDMKENVIETEPEAATLMEERLVHEMDGWELPEKVGIHSYRMPYRGLKRRSNE
jgi:arylsulfatase A-like enzyme